MKNKIFLIIFFSIILSNFSYSNETNCNEFKKFSINFMKCKSNKIKNKSVSFGKNLIEDTKDYQKKKWNEEKDNVEKIKKKVLK
jgi:hypothetical protein